MYVQNRKIKLAEGMGRGAHQRDNLYSRRFVAKKTKGFGHSQNANPLLQALAATGARFKQAQASKKYSLAQKSY